MTLQPKNDTDAKPVKKDTSVRDFVLACISPPDPASSERVAYYASTVKDWDAALASLRNHRLAPQAFVHAQLQSFRGFPETVSKALTSLHTANVSRQAAMRQALEVAVLALGRHDIPSICLRGPAMAELLYAPPSARHFDDLEVIVSHSDLQRARSVLNGLGYYPLAELPRSLQRKIQNAGGECLLKQPNLDFVLNLSWCVAPRYFKFEPIDWNKELVELTLDGEGIRTLNAEEYVMLLCTYGTQNMWSRLSWVADVAALLKRESLDWNRVISLAIASGGVRMLVIAVVLTHMLCNSHIPPPLQAWVSRDRRCWVHAKRVADAHMGNLLFNPKDDIHRAIFHIRCRERIRDRFHYIIHRLLQPSMNDYGAVSLPAALYPLYYLVRPIRLISKALCRI